MKTPTFDEHIDNLANRKMNGSDYWVMMSEDTYINTNACQPLKEGDVISREGTITLVSNEMQERYHPDNIDVVKFWECATEKFPFFSIAGSGDHTSIDTVKKSTLEMAQIFGALQHMYGYTQKLKDMPYKFNFLEIGCGYGNIYDFFQEYCSEHGRYFGLDVVKLFECDTLAKGDGYTIPDTLPDEFHIIYSFNVFQHLSMKQRQSYFADIRERLHEDGIFIFGTFVVDEHTEGNDRLWGIKREDGRPLINFFNQMTLALTETELKFELYMNGLELLRLPLSDEWLKKTNYRGFLVRHLDYGTE